MALPSPVDGAGPRYFGVYPALVTDLVDPDSLGRVQVKFPSLGTTGDRDVRAWATLCSPYADKDQGLQVLPEKESQVVVAFEAGDLRRPYVVGASWNGTRALPQTAQASNNIRVLRTRSDSRLEFDDTKGSPKVTLRTQSGHKVVLDAGAQEVTVTHSNGCTITLTSSGSIDINANSGVNVTAPKLTVTAATSVFTGMVQCKALIADVAVTSPLYSTGVGNLW
ncbi:phage baseplate assembly protein V [Cellulomonas sp. NPDC055163]